MSTQVTKNFTLEELLQLDKNVGDTPDDKVKENLIWGIKNVLQPLRDKAGIPVFVSVGWRGSKRNKRAKSVSMEHPRGQAGDIKMKPWTNEQIMKFCVEQDIPFYQIIDEQLYRADGTLGQWIHISWRILKPGQKAARILKTARNTPTNLKANITRI